MSNIPTTGKCFLIAGPMLCECQDCIKERRVYGPYLKKKWAEKCAVEYNQAYRFDRKHAELHERKINTVFQLVECFYTRIGDIVLLSTKKPINLNQYNSESHYDCVIDGFIEEMGRYNDALSQELVNFKAFLPSL